MKKVIGIILLFLFFISFWVGLSFVFYTGGLSLLWSILLPFFVYIGAALLISFIELVTWLLK